MGYFFGFELCVAAGDDDKRSGVLPGYLTDCLTTFLSASSVTEQVLTTQMSAFSPGRILRMPFSSRIFPSVEVSAKLSLQPNV